MLHLKPPGSHEERMVASHHRQHRQHRQHPQHPQQHPPTATGACSPLMIYTKPLFEKLSGPQFQMF